MAAKLLENSPSCSHHQLKISCTSYCTCACGDNCFNPHKVLDNSDHYKVDQSVVEYNQDDVDDVVWIYKMMNHKVA